MKVYIGNTTGNLYWKGPFEWIMIGPIASLRWRRVDVAGPDEDAYLLMI